MSDSVSPTILRTKLYRPPLTEDYVPRQQLHERLKLVAVRPLTIVSAPAGYGKSVLMSAWLEHCGCYGAWLSLDERDNDLGSFERYLLAAFRSEISSFGEDLLAMLDGARLPPTPVFVDALFDELSRLEGDFFLMVDDYSLITNDAVHELIKEMMRHPHPGLHLVLGTRHDPPLPLNEWRASNQLMEIRGADLRFSIEETTSFINQALHEQIGAETIASLNQKTEGWAAGLRLAVLSFSRIEDFQRRVEELSSTNVYIRDYLASQVLYRLPAEIQLFLLQTSILDRLCASLCQAVIMLEGPFVQTQATLVELTAANIFMIPLDDSQQWFRYHHLFDEFLQNRLQEDYSSEIVAALHSRASTWFAEHGYIEEALQHARAAGDMETAVQLVAQNRHEVINQEDFRRLSHWLDMFPQEIIEGSPDLLQIKAIFAQTVRFDIEELFQLVGKIDALLENLHFEPQRAQLLSAENDSLRGAALFYLDAEASLASLQRALEVLPQDWYMVRGYCWIFGATALQLMGDHEGAYEWIGRGRQEDLIAPGGPRTRNAAAEGFVSLIAADLTRLQQVAESMLGVVPKRGYWETQGWANHFLACASYHRNDLERAQRYAQQTFNNRYYHPTGNVDSAFILIMIQQANGRPEEARRMLKTAMDFATELSSPPFMSMVQFFQAELAVMQGRAHEFVSWAERANAHLQLTPMHFFYVPPLTIPKVLLADGSPGSRKTASDCLQRIQEYAESTHHTRVLIEVLALKALLYSADNNEGAALAALEESLVLAHPGGFVRLYIDLGPKIADLLRRLQNREPYSDYIESIISGFVEAAQLVSQPNGDGQLIESLTEREAQILDLLAERLTNSEIANVLVISPATVKRHTINIYQKLTVHNRREAVEVARALGLLPPA